MMIQNARISAPQKVPIQWHTCQACATEILNFLWRIAKDAPENIISGARQIWCATKTPSTYSQFPSSANEITIARTFAPLRYLLLEILATCYFKKLALENLLLETPLTGSKPRRNAPNRSVERPPSDPTKRQTPPVRCGGRHARSARRWFCFLIGQLMFYSVVLLKKNPK